MTGTPNGNYFPGGKTNRYAYSSGFADARLNHNLISCTDAKGQTWLQVTYRATTDPASLNFDTVDFVTRNGHLEHLRLFAQTPTPTNGLARVKAIVRPDAVGNVSEGFYDSRQRCVRLSEYTGRAPNLFSGTTEVANRPQGKLRQSDPDFYETRLEWNADSLCTKIISPRGNVTEMVYQRAYNQNSARSNHAKAAAHLGDLRLVREVACCDQDDDKDGFVDTLVSTFEYHPRFGSPALQSGRKGWAAQSREGDAEVF